MFAKVALLVVLAAVAVNSNPAANQPWHWIHKRVTVSPNFRATPFENVVKSIGPQKPRFQRGAVKVENCGTSPALSKIDPAIVGGIEAVPHAYPWQVALFIDNMYFCGGSIISEYYIMTAAHCMDGALSVNVVAGAHNVRNYEPSQVTITSTYSFVHESWGRVNLENDIAMIMLPSPLTFNDYIQPVCLPSGADLGEGVYVTPTGWGKDHDGIGGTTNELREVTVPTITNTQCNRYYGIVTDDMICISAAGGKGTCSGDSGGPMNYKVGGRTQTRGIVSFGSSAGCEQGIPDAFTRVNHFLDWIQDNTGVTN